MFQINLVRKCFYPSQLNFLARKIKKIIRKLYILTVERTWKNGCLINIDDN